MGYMKQLDIIDKQINQFANELDSLINDLVSWNPSQYALGDTIQRLRELSQRMREYPVL
jgi:conjugal transfer/entry exclusion protein